MDCALVGIAFNNSVNSTCGKLCGKLPRVAVFPRQSRQSCGLHQHGAVPASRQNTALYPRPRARCATLLDAVQAARDRESAVLIFAVPVVPPPGLADSIRSARVV